jgi:hypothetical protein
VLTVRYQEHLNVLAVCKVLTVRYQEHLSVFAGCRVLNVRYQEHLSVLACCKVLTGGSSAHRNFQGLNNGSVFLLGVMFRQIPWCVHPCWARLYHFSFLNQRNILFYLQACLAFDPCLFASPYLKSRMKTCTRVFPCCVQGVSHCRLLCLSFYPFF